MGKRIKKPGWLVSVKLGQRFVAVSSSVLTPFCVYLYLLTIWLERASSDWVRLPGHWLVFLFVTAFGIPLVISSVSGFMVLTIERRQGREVRGFLFSGATLLPDVKVSPSRPFRIDMARLPNVARVMLLTIVTTVALVVMNAQLGLDGPGPFRPYWIGTVAAGWSLIALPSALLDLLAVYLYPAPTPQVRARRFRIVAFAFLGLILAWLAVVALWPDDSSFRVIIRYAIGGPVIAGLLLAALIAVGAAVSGRVIARDLRQAAVEAVVVDGALRASDAVSRHETPGFLVTDQRDQLVGWLSREAAIEAPDSLLGDLARPLIDSVPIEAEQHASELSGVLDPHLDGREVVALAQNGTPVGYIGVARAFVYVTGDSAWSRFADPA